MTVNQTLSDEAIAHAVSLQQYSDGVVRRIIAQLNRTDVSLAQALADALDRLPADSFTVERLQLLLGQVGRINRDAYAAVSAALQVELEGLAKHEASYQASLFRATVPAPVLVRFPIVSISAEQLYAAAMARPFQGRLLKDWATDLDAGRMVQIRNAVRTGYLEGQSVADIVKRVRGSRATKYADGFLQRPRQDLATIVRSAVSHTAAVARDAFVDANGDIIKAVRWLSTLDAITSAPCRIRDQLQYTDQHKPIGHKVPWLQGPGKIHFNCVPGDQRVSVTSSIRRAYRRPYEGDLIVIRTAAGRNLSCTPKHPILTDAGWLAADALNLGDKVIAHLSVEWESIGNSENDKVPTTIEQVFESFVVSAGVFSVEVPIAAPDFHGDGANSEIAVVASDSRLCSKTNASFGEESFDSDLIIRCKAALSSLMSSCAGDQSLIGDDATACGLVSGGDEFLSFNSGESSHSSELLFGLVSSGDSSLSKQSVDDVGGYALGASDSGNTDARVEQANALGEISGSCVSVNGLQSPISQQSIDDAASDARLFDDIRNTEAGLIEADAIVEIICRSFSGHVYNLETEGGWFVAEGIVTHNCRSTSVPVTKSWRELGIPVDDLTPAQRASMDGQVPGGMTYGEWLKRQPPSRQVQVLGVERAAMMRDGATLDDFYSPSGKWLTLDELGVRNSEDLARLSA